MLDECIPKGAWCSINFVHHSAEVRSTLNRVYIFPAVRRNGNLLILVMANSWEEGHLWAENRYGILIGMARGIMEDDSQKLLINFFHCVHNCPLRNGWKVGTLLVDLWALYLFIDCYKIFCLLIRQPSPILVQLRPWLTLACPVNLLTLNWFLWSFGDYKRATNFVF